MTKDQWTYLVLKTAKEHPEWVDVTFQAFSAGVKEQARVNGSELPIAYPDSDYWTAERQEQCYDLYQKIGQALVEKNIRITWDDGNE